MESKCSICGEDLEDEECFNCFEDSIETEVLVPESKEHCFKCGVSHLIKTITWHEPLMGAKYRSISVEYKLQVPLCIDCHEFAQTEPSQAYNRYLQPLMQKKFIKENPDKDFMKIIGRNYL